MEFILKWKNIYLERHLIHHKILIYLIMYFGDKKNSLVMVWAMIG